MKVLLGFAAIVLFSLSSNADTSCRKFFPATYKMVDFKPEKALEVVELAAMYRENYIKSEQGKRDLENMSRILKVRIVPQKVQGMPFYEIRVSPKVSQETIQTLTENYPEVTVVYKLNSRMKMDRLNYYADEIVSFDF